VAEPRHSHVVSDAAHDGRRIGLIVNPLAGIGGRVGLKGSDGRDVVERALALGAVPEASRRVAVTLAALHGRARSFELLTCPAEMGADVARDAGYEPRIVGSIATGKTSAEDTRRAAMELRDAGTELLVFAGGDGTARDICAAVADSVPVLGIPAGVKIHSSVFALNPHRAADAVVAFLDGRAHIESMEVMDLDEDRFRAGTVAARLYGYLRVPYLRDLIQGAKAPSAPDSSTSRGIAFAVLDLMDAEPETLFVLGPGSTVKAIGDEMGIDTTLLGVDVVAGHRLVARDVGESALLELIAGREARIVVTVIGGQGMLFGRGNQQLSPRVIRAIGREHIVVIATLDKLHALGGPLVVDTGDPDCDQALAGYLQVITGERERVVWKVVA